MKVTGIIAECNPLHEGHKYLLQEARKNTGADYIVIAMSGDYVQRGAPAVVSKEQRACALLQNGADLVLELPLYVSDSGADYFARGGVSLLESLGVVTDLAFGSESGDLSLLQDAARELNEDTEAFREVLQNGLRKGLTFPQARAEAIADMELPASPNDLLGTEYLRALDRTGSRIRPHAIPRTDAVSASYLRAQMLKNRRDSDPYLCRDDFSDHLLHALYVARGAEDLSVYLDVSADLAGRILHELPSLCGNRPWNRWTKAPGCADGSAPSAFAALPPRSLPKLQQEAPSPFWTNSPERKTCCRPVSTRSSVRTCGPNFSTTSWPPEGAVRIIESRSWRFASRS